MKTQTILCATYLLFGPALAAKSAGRNRLPAKRRSREFEENKSEPLPQYEVGLYRAAAARANYTGQTRPRDPGQGTAPAKE